jgi:alginate O-acetyltransferase complex protein AlgI
MAIGLGRFFNVELPINFNRPYKASNPSDFWKRWHISLSQWLRDYLYIPLGGNRCSQFRNNLNLLLTMVIGGFWHGANWTFIIWGFIHGSAIVIYNQFKSYETYFFGRITFLFLVLFAWIFFRATNFSEASLWIQKHFFLYQATRDLNLVLLIMILIGIGLVVAEPNLVKLTFQREQLSIRVKIILGILFGVCLSLIGKSSVFLYFQF